MLMHLRQSNSLSLGSVLLLGCLSIACGSSDPSVDGGTLVDSGLLVDSGTLVGGGMLLDATFLTGTWLSGCDIIGSSSAKYCATFSGTDGYASRTMFFAASTTCTGASMIIPGSGTYALAGRATTPSEATKVDVVIQGAGALFSILARDGATLKFGKEDGAHNGTSDAQRYQIYMAAPYIKGTCPF